MQKKYIALAMMGVVMFGAAQARAEGKDGVAAVVNGQKITVAEIREAYNETPGIKDRVSFKDFYQKTLDVFVNGALVLQAADKAKVQDTEAYKKQLKLAEDELARKIYMEEQVDKMITKAEIEKAYKEYTDSFKSEKEIKAKHILVDSESKAKEVISKLKKGGDFDKLAKQYSKEPADLGYFGKGIMVPEFAEAAFSMKKGEYSKTPVKTQFGYHVILVEDFRDAKVLPYKQVEPQFKAILTQGTLAEVFQQLQDKAKITKYDINGQVIK